MKNLLILSKNEKLINAINNINTVNIVNVIDNKDDLYSSISQCFPSPDIVLATEGVDGSNPLVDTLCMAKDQFPSIKFCYMAGCDLDINDEMQVNTLALLVDHGIYDIYVKRKVTIDAIADLILNDRTKEDVLYLYRFHQRVNPLPERPVYDNSIRQGRIEEGRKNVIVFSSVKPGSGKSFISTNIAADIARFGCKKKDGQLPNVVIVEGDLQTLSVGTLLGIENSRYNLREALNEAAKIVSNEGQIIGDQRQQAYFKEFVRKCCLPYRDQANLYALVGSQLNFTDLGNIDPYQYFYMIKVISEMFDYVIIDANSSLDHKTTGPILQLANQCFYILDLDFNNIRTNLRYRQELSTLGVDRKIKYILNKAITKEIEDRFAEKIEYGEDKLNANGFEIVGRIPMLDNVVVLNRMFSKTPIVYDDGFATLSARMEFCKLSSLIHPMDNALQLKIELENTIKNKKKKKSRK